MPAAVLRSVPPPIPLPPPLPVAPSLTGVQKAAVLVMYLDRDAARALLKGLSDDEVERIATTIAEMGDSGEETVEAVVTDFVAQLRQVSVLPASGRNFARNVLPGLFDDDRRARMGAHLRRIGDDDFEAFVRTRPARAVVSVLSDEHPQVRAIAMLRMGTENAARVLACMPVEDQTDLAIRMAQAESVAPELAEDIEAALRRALVGFEDGLPLGGVERTARILGRMPRERNARVLDGVRALEGGLADDLQRRMVSFEDLERLDSRGIQALLRAVERPDLIIALKGASPTMRDQFLKNLSARAAADLLEEIEIGGPARRAQLRESQDRVVAIARHLADEGTIYLDLGEPADGVA
ncbi:MAG: FliG C-terminal domain-containing protein [Pseudomonadota bacterium]|nr:FliG C-terminal domain-containing protein [Pseudomonadota bacterium]